jgi:hypothetical protein
MRLTLALLVLLPLALAFHRVTLDRMELTDI